MNISPAVTNALAISWLKIQKHAPEILTTIGVGSVLTGAFFAAKNTLKLEERIDEGADRLETVNEAIEAGELKESARAAVYVRNTVEVGKLYVIPGTLIIGGIICFLGANHILNQRTAAAVAAYNGLAASYKAYRKRVEEELGEEKEKEIFYGEKTVTETVDGKKVTRKVLSDGEHVGSPYRFVYDMYNDNWTGFHDQNLFRVITAQNMYNDLLQSGRPVFLRDVLITLGIEPTPASAVTGWLYRPDDPEHNGDNFIEFNIRDYQAEHGYILLDFNVDGEIWHKI